MATADLGQEPWSRLVKLAPPATSAADLQEAANRWVATNDLFAAAADLWEEKAISIDLTPDEETAQEDRPIKSVTQDGISVTYEDARTSYSTRVAFHGQCLNKARFFRQKAKPKSPLTHPDYYDAWSGRDTRDVDWDDIYIGIPDDEVVP